MSMEPAVIQPPKSEVYHHESKEVVMVASVVSQSPSVSIDYVAA